MFLPRALFPCIILTTVILREHETVHAHDSPDNCPGIWFPGSASCNFYKFISAIKLVPVLVFFILTIFFMFVVFLKDPGVIPKIEVYLISL